MTGLVLAMLSSGCAATTATNKRGDTAYGAAIERVRQSGPSGGVVALSDDLGIQNLEQANVAKARANRTVERAVDLLKAAKNPRLSKDERLEKEEEAKELQRQSHQEMQPVKAYFRRLAREIGSELEKKKDA